VESITAETGEQGIKLLNRATDIDLVLVDIMMPGMDGYATMRAMRELPSGGGIPLVAFTAKVETGERQRCIDAGASAYVPKPIDTKQLLGILGEWYPAEPSAVLEPPSPAFAGIGTATAADPDLPALEPLPALAHPAGTRLAGRKVLVVDDDVRNIFAVAALLRRSELDVISAESGEQGIALLEQTPDVDLVLVDIMMPGMDGYATMRAMRQLPSGETVPLVAFTAKVEDGERQRCIDAGASEYLAKPVETDQLLGILGEWLPAAAIAGRPSDAVD
jgi:CheY-like chemotaxis protein